MTSGSSDVFLSYSREERATAQRYADSLRQEGFTVWWDQTLSTGEAYDEVIEAALEGAKAVVVLWSKKSVVSRWVRAEATLGDRNKALAPVKIEECRLPIMFELTQTAELSHWNGSTSDPAWRAFVADLWRLVRRETQSGLPVQSQAHAASPTSVARRRLRLVPVTLAVLAIIVAGAGTWAWKRARSADQAREAVAEVSRLADAGDYPAAFALAEKVRAVLPDDPMLASITPLFTSRYSIATSPEGAQVSIRDYSARDAKWQRLGTTPLAGVELPRRVLRWRVEKEGFESVEMTTPLMAKTSGFSKPLDDDLGEYAIQLRAKAEQPPDMVFIPSGPSPANAKVRSVEVPSFFMDRHEVSNSEFKEFVAAGGYERPSWWEGLDMRRGNQALSNEQAMDIFVDATGRPGPATWELGSYPDDKADHPVSGISWYEAAAYARFRGKSLPTAYHWLRASLPGNEILVSMASSITRLSNFGTTGTLARTQSQAMGPYGTYDMFGNVREWLMNDGTVGGLVIGGDWQDPPYSYGDLVNVDRMERSALNGFRLMKELAPAPNDALLRAAVVPPANLRTNYTNAKAVSDEVYATFVRQFAYKSAPVVASAPVTLESTEDWVKQKVTLDAGYNGEYLDVVLFIPKRAKPPFQPIVFFSGIQIVLLPDKIETIQPGFAGIPLDYVVKSGRVLVQPVFQGTYERFKEPVNFADELRTIREWVERRWDLGRTLDYLESRPDIDSRRAGYVGVSFGASYALPLLATEPRLKAAVFISGGYGSAPLPPIVDSVNHVPRIRIPLLMVNGRFDHVISLEGQQRPMFEQLGTSPKDKRFVLLDFGHGSPPRAETLRETLGWFDKYLGPPGR